MHRVSSERRELSSHRTKCNKGQFCNGLSASSLGAVVSPSEQAAQHNADDGGEEPVPSLIASEYSYRFLRIKEPVRRGETFRSNDDIGAWRDLEIPKPIGLGTEAAHHDHLGKILPKLHDFQDGIAREARVTANMDQQQIGVRATSRISNDTNKRVPGRGCAAWHSIGSGPCWAFLGPR